MPKRIREQILEVTKTVTVTEIVNAAPDKHHRSCEVTITNIASDTCHPVSVKINHLHEREAINRTKIRTQSPNMTVEEQTWDAIQAAPEGTTRIEQEQQTKVERIVGKHMPVTTTFNLQTDNVIDLQFTQPVLVEKHDQQHKQPQTTETFGRGAVHTLFYQDFSNSNGLLDIARSPISIHSDITQGGLVVDEADLGFMASDLSDEDSVTAHVGNVMQKRQSSMNKNLCDSGGSPKSFEGMEQETSGRVPEERLGNDFLNNVQRKYIVTSKEETNRLDRGPTITWIYAEFHPSLKKKSVPDKNLGASRSGVNEGTAGSKDFYEQVPCTSTSLVNGHAIFNPALSSEAKGPRVVSSRQAVTALTRARGASESSSFSANDAFTEFGSGVHSDHENLQNRDSIPPPIPSSAKLKQENRSSAGMSSDGCELRQSRSFSTILLESDSDITNKENTVHYAVAGEPLPSSHRRVPSLPIVVVNQKRKGSLDYLKERRKHSKFIVTDIDWFDAFKMKEPSKTKLSQSASGLDIMKQAENAGEHLVPQSSRDSGEQIAKLDDIDMDEIFYTSFAGKSTKSCPCNACYLTKLSDDERIVFARKSSTRTKDEKNSLQRPPPSRSAPAIVHTHEMISSEGKSRIHIAAVSGAERPGVSKIQDSNISNEKGAEEMTFYLENTASSTLQTSYSDIDLDKIFSINSSDYSKGIHRKPEDIKPAVGSPRIKETHTIPKFLPQPQVGWVEALVDDGNESCRSLGTELDKEVESKEFQFSEPKEIDELSLSLARPANPGEQKSTSTSNEGEQPPDMKRVAARDTSNDLMSSVFDRRSTSECDDRKCKCAACAIDTSTASLTKELKHRSLTKEKMLPRADSHTHDTPILQDVAISSQGSSEEKINGSAPALDASLGTLSVPCNPDAIHFPSGRTALVGDVLRKPSILEETSFNTDHLSSINDVSKAYAHRLTQLKSELDLSELDASSTTVPTSATCVKSEHAGTISSRPAFCLTELEGLSEASKREPISDEALIDAVFSAVFEGESSGMTSLGAAPTSQNLHAQDRSETNEPPEKNYDGSKDMLCPNFDEWYDSPTAAEDNEVKDYVAELLNKSMEEAIFSASKSLQNNGGMKQEFIFPTDKILREQNEPVLVKPNGQNKEEQEEDPILKAVFTSSIDNQQYMESVISYPGSATSSRITSSTNTPGPGRTRKDSEVFFPTNSAPALVDDATFVSSASVVMNNTHSSTEGEFEDDYFMKLVTSEKKEEIVPSKETVFTNAPQGMQALPKSAELQGSSEAADILPNSGIGGYRSLPPMENDHGKADEELLEVEVFPGYFHIKGSYSLIVNKGDPLGRLLAEVHSKGSSSSMDFSITPKLRKMLSQCFKEKAKPSIEGGASQGDLICSRARNLLTDEDVSNIVYSMIEKNRFNADLNPEGNINFCTAENNVCTEELMSQLKSKGFSPIESHLIHYPPAGGHLSTKEVVAKYFAEFMSAKPQVEELVILPSSTSAYDMLCHCTCEAEDIILTSAPTYSASVRNCRSRAECRIQTVEIDMESPRLDVEAYQKKLDYFTAEGAIVRAILIINPHNPLGAIFSPDEVLQLCNWATRNNLVVLVDESFSSCVFEQDSSFKSFLSYRSHLENPENVIYLWSLSKDFGAPGLKISIVQSCSPKLVESLAALEVIHPVSAVAHDVAVAILSDFDWLRNFHETKRKRLSAHYKYTTDHLREMGLPFCPAVAGCFVMVDFRKHLRSQTFANELSLFQSLCDRGVMLTPGQHVLCQQPGWMRLVFGCNKKELIEGIHRMRLFFNLSAENDEASIEF